MENSTPSHRNRNKENIAPENSLPTPQRTLFHTPLQPRQENQLRFSTPLTSLSFTPPPSTTPSTKRRRRIATQSSLDEISSQQSAYQERLQHEQHVKEEAEKSAKRARIHKAGLGIRQAGYPTVHSYLSELLTAEDPLQSSQISQLLVHHSARLLDLARARQPQIIDDWIISSHRELISSQCQALASHFRPEIGSSVTQILDEFSVKGFLAEAELIAPLVCQVLHQVGISESVSDFKYKDQDLIIATTLCMLAKSRNGRATEFQTTMCMYFLACGTSRSLFDVLNHAGILLSYTQAILKLKKLGEERLETTRKIARTRTSSRCYHA